MNKNAEITLLENAIKNNLSSIEIEKLCKGIIKRRLESNVSYDAILQKAVLDILNVFSFPMKTSIVPLKKVDGRNDVLLVKTFSVLSGGLGICLLRAKSFLPRLVGGAMCLVAGFGLKSAFTKPQPSLSSATLICTSTASELIAEIDSVYAKFLDIVNHNQLEGRHKDVLFWLQRIYSENEDKRLENELLKLMLILGYEFVKYSSDESENFEVSNANVSEIVTTIFAVRNKATGVVVLPGVVVFPKEDNV